MNLTRKGVQEKNIPIQSSVCSLDLYSLDRAALLFQRLSPFLAINDRHENWPFEGTFLRDDRFHAAFLRVRWLPNLEKEKNYRRLTFEEFLELYGIEGKLPAARRGVDSAAYLTRRMFFKEFIKT